MERSGPRPEWRRTRSLWIGLDGAEWTRPEWSGLDRSRGKLDWSGLDSMERCGPRSEWRGTRS
eukprot:2641034-Pleurochrysis_carterae.AAC.1